MYLDVVHLRAFYDLPLGRLLRSLVGAPIRKMWPDLKGQSLLGIGYAGPFMRPYLDNAERAIAGMPAPQGAIPWPPERDSACALVQDGALPFPDAYFDRVMLVHAIDHCSDPSSMLKEVWRVLAPGGRVIAVVPNRRGLWARSEHSPFGYGRPYSSGQLKELMKNSQFNVLDDREAVFMPPSKSRYIVQAARTWESVGRRIWPAFGGILIMEAEKVIFRSIPTGGEKARLRVLRPVFIPEGVATGLKPVRAARPRVMSL
ncbi:class I SAM-dependent methyltransferase [Roseibium denhamense]|uniref:Methyltransferase domain-containing protein n=2 Tax=Roseibium denhamense TaxID=76305 RepID=A0ABY1PB68_9HYPH|nr:class I SAM-dependent methyltransferase [Roseibium denhamense]SMP30026.1 Methyltransferase domain-containing protein [Roseibium denhamense]